MFRRTAIKLVTDLRDAGLLMVFNGKARSSAGDPCRPWRSVADPDRTTARTGRSDSRSLRQSAELAGPASPATRRTGLRAT